MKLLTETTQLFKPTELAEMNRIQLDKRPPHWRHMVTSKSTRFSAQEAVDYLGFPAIIITDTRRKDSVLPFPSHMQESVADLVSTLNALPERWEGYVAAPARNYNTNGKVGL